MAKYPASVRSALCYTLLSLGSECCARRLPLPRGHPWPDSNARSPRFGPNADRVRAAPRWQPPANAASSGVDCVPQCLISSLNTRRTVTIAPAAVYRHGRRGGAAHCSLSHRADGARMTLRHLVQPYSTITVLLGFTSSVGLSFNQRPNSLFSRRQLGESPAAGGAVSPTYNMACY